MILVQPSGVEGCTKTISSFTVEIPPSSIYNNVKDNLRFKGALLWTSMN